MLSSGTSLKVTENKLMSFEGVFNNVEYANEMTSGARVVIEFRVLGNWTCEVALVAHSY